MKYEDPVNYTSTHEGEQNWRSALIQTIGALLMLILGFIGNGVI